jgi:hypothetical protein
LRIVAAAIARFACLGDRPVASIPADALRTPPNSALVTDSVKSRLSPPAVAGRNLPSRLSGARSNSPARLIIESCEADAIVVNGEYADLFLVAHSEVPHQV